MIRSYETEKCSNLNVQRLSPAARRRKARLQSDPWALIVEKLRDREVLELTRSNLEGTARSKSVDLTKGIELIREFSEGLLNEESSRKEESPKVNS